VDNPLWDYSVDVYRLEEVAPTCLALQDDFEVDVNLVLYAAWLARLERRLSAAHLRAVDERVAKWRGAVVRPLRALRRALRGLSPAASIRAELKALELRAERHQQDIIYRYYRRAEPLSPGTGALAENLALVARYCSHRETGWEGAIRRLHDLLSP